jgi:predicted AAA+ superfamily ATPase
MDKYFKRIMDNILEEELEVFGAVLLTGPKACGKTTTAALLSKSALYMQDPDKKESYLELAKIKPSRLLDGETPRLIDEWQMAPQLWDAVRFSVDLKNKTGLYILTGSTAVDESKISHSGAGRIARVMMRPMSLYESLDSNGSVSLKEIFDGKHEIEGKSNLSIEKISNLIVRGGWPSAINKSSKAAMRLVSAYCDTIASSEIQTVDGKKRDKEKTKSLLRSLARLTGSMATETTILDDVVAHHASMHRNTLSDYINALKQLYIIDDVPAWSPKLRSKTQIRTSNKRYFVDPSIAASMLKTSPENLFSDMNTFGLLFESLVIRDLKIYTHAIGGNVFHYHDRSGLEADAVIHLDDGRWGLVEVKLGTVDIDKAANNLLTISNKIVGKPSFLMIVTGADYVYKRKDGVLVVPIGCLKN